MRFSVFSLFLFLSALSFCVSPIASQTQPAGTCTYSGNDYSQLSNVYVHETASEGDGGTYNYYIVPCGVLSQAFGNGIPAGCVNGNTQGCQENQMTGGTYTEIEWSGPGPLQYSFLQGSADNGIQITYPEIENRQIVLEVWCPNSPNAPPNPPAPVPSGHVHTIVVKDNAACVGGNNGNGNGNGGSPSHGLSGGWVFCIIVFVCVPVYFAAGCGWNYYKGARGVSELTPQYPFWASIPGLVKDGCVFSVNKVKALISGKPAASGPGYETL